MQQHWVGVKLSFLTQPADAVLVLSIQSNCLQGPFKKAWAAGHPISPKLSPSFKVVLAPWLASGKAVLSSHQLF